MSPLRRSSTKVNPLGWLSTDSLACNPRIDSFRICDESDEHGAQAAGGGGDVDFHRRHGVAEVVPDIRRAAQVKRQYFCRPILAGSIHQVALRRDHFMLRRHTANPPKTNNRESRGVDGSGITVKSQFTISASCISVRLASRGSPVSRILNACAAADASAGSE